MMPLWYKMDPKWCKKILNDVFEVSVDDLEWIKQVCSKKGYIDRDIPDK